MEIENSFDKFREIVIAIRNIRTENQIAFKEKCTVYFKFNDIKTTLNDNIYQSYISSICNVDLKSNIGDNSTPGKTITRVFSNFELDLVLPTGYSNDDNLKKYKKDAEKLEAYLSTLNKKLSNPGFIKKASPEVVESEKLKKEETENKLNKIRELIQSLS